VKIPKASSKQSTLTINPVNNTPYDSPSANAVSARNAPLRLRLRLEARGLPLSPRVTNSLSLQGTILADYGPTFSD
jgi:hypothetical protein